MSNEKGMSEAASKKRKRGRPPINISKTISLDGTRRTLVNAQYMFEAISIIKEAASKIPDNHLLWYSDDLTQTANGKHGILEQIGRMYLQDGYDADSCIIAANCSVSALKAGYTSREIERAIRALRTATRKLETDPKNKRLRDETIEAAHTFRHMGGLE